MFKLAQLLQDLTSLSPTILLEKKTMVGCYTGIQNSSGWKAETSVVWLLKLGLNNGDCSGWFLRYITMVLRNSKEHIIYITMVLKEPILTYDDLCSGKRTSQIISQTGALACFLQFSVYSKFWRN
jgi:hypothetical protein